MKPSNYRDRNLESIKRRIIQRRIRTSIFFAVLTLFIVFTVWFLREGAIFKVREVNIYGNKRVSKEEVETIVEANKKNLFISKILKRDNILLWYLLDNQDIEKSNSYFHTIKIKPHLWKKIVDINIEEKQESFVVCRDDSDVKRSCFWLDASGRAFAQSPDTEGNLMTTIIDQSGRELKIGDYLLTDSEMNNFKKILAIRDKWSWLVQSINLQDDDQKEILLILKDGQEIYFNLKVDPSYGDAIVKTLNEDGVWERVLYLDLRITGKGFYKLKR